MTRPDRIVGDWGTSNLRLYLFAGDELVGQQRGPGLAPLLKAGDAPQQAFAQATESWFASHGALPATLCGMIGSNLGWIDAGYADAPADAAALAARRVLVDQRGAAVSILPGVACMSWLEGPDVMRGEETQIFGALELLSDLRTGARIFCLPGTHSKWVRVIDGAITSFQTVLTGETYALLAQHSILLRGDAPQAVVMTAFEDGVRRIVEQGAAALLPLLFETRARQLRSGLDRDAAAAFLSGLVIGAECAWAADHLPAGNRQVTLVGEPHLCDLYHRALMLLAISSEAVDGEQAVRAGLLKLTGYWQ